MFPRAKRAKVDTEALGARMAERKAELQEDLAVSPEDSVTAPARQIKKKDTDVAAKAS